MLRAPPAAPAVRQVHSDVVDLALVLLDDHHADICSSRCLGRLRTRCDPSAPPQASLGPGARPHGQPALGRARELAVACRLVAYAARSGSGAGRAQGTAPSAKGRRIVPQGVLPSARLCLGLDAAPVDGPCRPSPEDNPRALLRPSARLPLEHEHECKPAFALFPAGSPLVPHPLGRLPSGRARSTNAGRSTRRRQRHLFARIARLPVHAALAPPIRNLAARRAAGDPQAASSGVAKGNLRDRVARIVVVVLLVRK